MRRNVYIFSEKNFIFVFSAFLLQETKEKLLALPYFTSLTLTLTAKKTMKMKFV